MSETAEMSTDDDINEQLIIAAVDRLHAAIKCAKSVGNPFAGSLFKRDQVATLDALTAFFTEQTSDANAFGKKR